MADQNPPPFLIFGAPAIGEAEIAEVEACLRSGWLGTGPRTQRFEAEFAAYKGVPASQAAGGRRLIKATARGFFQHGLEVGLPVPSTCG